MSLIQIQKIWSNPKNCQNGPQQTAVFRKEFTSYIAYSDTKGTFLFHVEHGLHGLCHSLLWPWDVGQDGNGRTDKRTGGEFAVLIFGRLWIAFAKQLAQVLGFVELHPAMRPCRATGNSFQVYSDWELHGCAWPKSCHPNLDMTCFSSRKYMTFPYQNTKQSLWHTCFHHDK